MISAVGRCVQYGDVGACGSEADISPYFWHSGKYPDSPEYQALFDNDFADYRLRVGGLVEKPTEFDLASLRAMPHNEQITRRLWAVDLKPGPGSRPGDHLSQTSHHNGKAHP